MNSDKETIEHGYVIGKRPTLDEAIGSNDDKLLFLFDSEQAVVIGNRFDSFNLAAKFKNELVVAKTVEKLQNEGCEAFPLYYETVVSPVNEEVFGNYMLQIKRQKALDKLTEEDKIILGLIGA